MQPLSPAVNYGNKSPQLLFDMVLTSLRAKDCVATNREQRLFEGGVQHLQPPMTSASPTTVVRKIHVRVCTAAAATIQA